MQPSSAGTFRAAAALALANTVFIDCHLDVPLLGEINETVPLPLEYRTA